VQVAGRPHHRRILSLHTAVALVVPGCLAHMVARPGTEDEGTYDNAAPDEDDVEEELAAYNEYLAALNASGRRKHW
jgi:hypothetical protein